MKFSCFRTLPILAVVAQALCTGCTTSEKRCTPGCIDATTRLECDEKGNARAVECPASAEPCAAATCQEGVCSYRSAVDSTCGPGGSGRCNEGYACMGANVRLSAIRQHTCMAAEDGKVWCWGDNFWGELGDGTVEDGTHPVMVRGLPGTAVDVSAGYAHTCALLDSGEAYCWGNNSGGQSAPDTTEDRIPAPRRVATDVHFSSIHAGQGHTCAITPEARVYCWGNTAAGQCGVEPTDTIQVGPTEIPGLDRVHALETVKNHICAVRTTDPTLVCWGSNQYLEDGGYTVGKLGPAAANKEYSSVPIPVNLGAKVVDVGMSYESTYAVTEDGTTYGWGYNGSGQLGNGSDEKTVAAPTPVMVSPGEPLKGTINALRTDGSDQCAEVEADDSSSRYLCWGMDHHGELGLGLSYLSFVPFARPASVIPASGRHLVRGEDHGCFVNDERDRVSIWCYGKVRLVANGSIAEEGRQIVAAPIVWDSSPPPWLADAE